MTLEYVIGPNGGQVLVHDSYHFYKESINSNKTYWTCKYKKRFGCLARIHTLDEKIVKCHKSHNHPIETQLNVDAEEIRTEIKKTNGGTKETPEDAHCLDRASQSDTVKSPSPVHLQENIQGQTFKYVIGPQGWRKLVHGSYYFHEVEKRSNITYWTCDYQHKSDCPARIKTSDDKIVKYHKSHNHPIETQSNVDAAERPEIKIETHDLMETPNYILAQCLDGASQSVTVKLPNLGEHIYTKMPLNRQEATLPEEFAGTSSGTEHLTEETCNANAGGPLQESMPGPSKVTVVDKHTMLDPPTSKLPRPSLQQQRSQQPSPAYQMSPMDLSMPKLSRPSVFQQQRTHRQLSPAQAMSPAPNQDQSSSQSHGQSDSYDG